MKNALHSKYLWNFMDQKCSAHSTLPNIFSPIIIAGNPHKSNSVFYRHFTGTQVRWNSCLRVLLSITGSSDKAFININCHSSVMLTCFIKILATFSKAGKLIDWLVHSFTHSSVLPLADIFFVSGSSRELCCSGAEAFMSSPGYLWSDRFVEEKLGNGDLHSFCWYREGRVRLQQNKSRKSHTREEGSQGPLCHNNNSIDKSSVTLKFNNINKTQCTTCIIWNYLRDRYNYFCYFTDKELEAKRV